MIDSDDIYIQDFTLEQWGWIEELLANNFLVMQQTKDRYDRVRERRLLETDAMIMKIRRMRKLAHERAEKEKARRALTK